MELIQPGFKQFADPTYFQDWFSKIRWSLGKITCPRCYGTRVPEAKHKTMSNWCTDCRKYFSFKTNTLMEGSSVSLHNWGLAVYFEVEKITGVRTTRLSKILKITQSTAWKLLYRIHEVFDTEQCPEEFEFSKYFHIDLRTLSNRSNSKPADSDLVNGLEKSGDLLAICITELGSLKIWTNVISVADIATIADIVTEVIPKYATIFMDNQYQKWINNKSNTIKHCNGTFAEMLAQTKGLKVKSNKTLEQKWEVLNYELEKIANSSNTKDRHRKLKILSGRWNLQFHDIEERLKIVFTAMCDKKFAK